MTEPAVSSVDRGHASHGGRKVVLAALAGNFAIAATKFGAAMATGSSAMLTEGVHSLVDTGNQGLLLLGLRRAARPPSDDHPFGHGMEVYFWSFVVALMIFALGGAFSVYEGVLKVLRPEPIERAWISFAVIGAAMLFEGASFAVAWREFRQGGRNGSVLRSIRASKDPTVFSVLMEDGAALAGLTLALLGLIGAVLLDWPQADGAASIAIGLLLVGVAVFLANETRSLLTGEAASPGVIASVRKVLADDPRVVSVAEVLSMHLGPNEVLLGVTLDFDDALPGGAVERAADELTQAIQKLDPRLSRVFLRPGRPAAAAR